MAGFAYVDQRGRDLLSEDEWNRVLDAWHQDPASWPADIGPPPGTDGSSAPYDLVLRARDRHRKRRERQRQAEATAARQREADAKLRDELIAAAGGCVVRGPALDDVSVIRRILADGVPMDTVTTAIRGKCDKRIYPKNEPAASWREERILRAVAEWYCRRLAKNMVATWQAAGSAPQRP